MNRKTLFSIFTLLTILSFLAAPVKASPALQEEPPKAQASEPGGTVAFTGVDPAQVAGGSPNGLGGSYVSFAPEMGGDSQFVPGTPGSFIFKAYSQTVDWEYVYNVWLKFPTDWVVTNVSLVGTPTCTGGGTWGTLTWTFENDPYAINISHARYQAYTDTCTAYYQVDVVAGGGLEGDVSWYWDGDGYNAAPHHPCSDDSYTPPSMSATPCDDASLPQASIPGIPADPGVYLFPEAQDGGGCNGTPATYDLTVFNNVGADATFNLSYAIIDGDGILTGPATIFVAQGATASFEATLTPGLCSPNLDVVVGQVDVSGGGYTDSAVLNHEITSDPGWDAIPGSAPSWAGMGYPRDGCTAFNSAGDTVTYLIGDMSGISGFWGYNHDTNTWFQPGPTNLPADRWAPDWAYDADTNKCYVTGGANTPGGGTYTEAYMFDPVANSFTQLGNFTTLRDFHNSWVGTIDSVKYLCIGGGVTSASSMLTSTQCYDLSQAAPGVWNAENAQMGMLPNDPFGAADGLNPAVTGDQFWYVGGAVNAGASISDAAYYWDDADNAWHSAGNTGVPRYRVEGDFLDGAFYQVAGSSGGFTPTTDAVRGTFNGTGWTWTPLPNAAVARMDNIVTAGDSSIWSVDGYGASAPAYVEKLAFCPLCDVQGFLEGNVYDGDTQPPKQADAIDSLSGSYVVFDPTAGGDTCYDPGVDQTFCYRAESYSPDYAYVYNLWETFPDDWTVNDVYVTGTPWCDNGSWGTFSWTFELEPYEVNIDHARYQGSGGAHCVATYCFDVTTGANAGDAESSWYWAGDDYGSPPDHPCSSDIYTPASQTDACDEWVNPQAAVPSCGPLDLNPPCTTATVTINPGNITVGVDPVTGHYGPVMLVAGEYEVEASAPGFSTETATVTIVDEETTVQDFVLYRPVIDVTPTSFDVASTPNVPVTLPLDISNLGSLPLDWEITEVGPIAAGVGTGVTAAKFQPVAAYGVDSAIAEQMASAADGQATFFIAFKDTANLAGADLITDKTAKVEWVRNALRTAADKAQAGVRAWLDSQGIEYKVFYIDNTIMVTANAAVLDALNAFPEIAGFHGNHTYELFPVRPASQGWAAALTNGSLGPQFTVEPDATIPWDLNIMTIPQVWDMGVTGDGVIVANVDTGVAYQHEALFPNYLCGAGPHADCWEDPDGGTTSPNDGNGHGTGTMSQMAADNNAAFQYAVGGAPDADWIACLGCPGGSCPDTALNGCADWLVMTTPNTPDIVNNSWGTWSALCNNWYDGKIAAYRAAGIVPVWAAGNIGNGCGTSTPPANSIGTLAVGATTSADVQAGFSSTGPGLCTGRTQFPDVSAPGDSTCGATTSGGYTCGLSGTSFAAPRTAGCLALMKQAAPGATVQQLMDAIMATADTKVNGDCGAPQNDPNYRYGEGRVNCLAAVQSVYNSNLPWVTTSPVSGTVPADGLQEVEVTFECTPEMEGYILTGTLRIDHNDPCNCDGDACSGGAPINIPLTFTCGTPTEADINVEPGSLSSTLISGESETQQLNIGNTGTSPLDWEIVEHQPAASAPATLSTASSGRPVELTMSGAGGASIETNPPVSMAPVQLVLDDGSRDNDIGIGGTIEFLWLNRFTPDPASFPFNLNQVQLYFSAVGLVNVGDQIDIVVYENTSGNSDPAVGSNFLAKFPVTVQALDTWSVYDLPTPVYLAGPGDVLIGVIGLEVPGTSYWPASIDQTVTQARSWAGWWLSSPPPVAPILPPDDTWGLIDSFGFAGNWMVRGYGETAGELPPECENADISWASVDPTSGTTPGHSDFFVDVTFDATGLAAGDYSGNLCVISNDADEPYVVVPLALTVLGYPDIEVDPLFLSATLPPNDTTTQQLEICNVGDLPLDWSLIEQEPVTKNGVLDILIDQPPNAVNGLFSDSSCSLCPTGQQSIADNFILDETTYLEQIVFWTGYFSSDTPIDPDILRVIIHTDSGGVPGSVVYDETPVAYERAQTGVVLFGVHEWMHTLTLADSVQLPAGTYWLEIFNNTGADDDDFFWETGDQDLVHGIYDSVWAQETPGSGWMANDGLDSAFQLIGSVIPPFDATWLSEDPIGGTIAPNTCQTVDVTFDSTGLAAGDYFADLAISSNDPDEPEVIVPVQLTVLGGPEIDVTPLLIDVELFPDDTTTAILTIANTGSEDLTFDLAEVLPWLSLSQSTGTVPAGGSVEITVTFDSAGLQIGDFFGGDITVTSNDADEPTILVHVTLTIVDPLPYKLYLPIIMKNP